MTWKGGNGVGNHGLVQFSTGIGSHSTQMTSEHRTREVIKNEKAEDQHSVQF